MGKQCQYCNKRDAKIHFTEIKDGKQTEMHICEQCAHEKNMAMAFPSLLSHIVKGPETGLGRAESDAVPAACPGCGMPYADFKSKGRLGCARCYAVFAPVLVPLLEKVHGAARHKGAAPPRAPEPEPEVEVEVEPEAPEAPESGVSLEEQLKEAVAAEDYEQAAALRDQIRALRKGDAGES